ncbi:Adenylate cyclase, partial [Tetrabaena socialis]
VPQSWDELAAFGASYSALRPAWAPTTAFCAAAGPTCDGSALFNAIWQSIAQSQGASQGVHFMLGTMQPLAGTAAFVAAARLFASIWKPALPAPSGYCGYMHPGLARGACVLSVGTLEQVKDVATGVPVGAFGANSSTSALPAAAFSVTQLPGSPYVLDAGNNSNLVLCSVENCPFSDMAHLRADPKASRAAAMVAVAAFTGSAPGARRRVLGSAGQEEEAGSAMALHLAGSRLGSGLGAVQAARVYGAAAVPGSGDRRRLQSGSYLVNRAPFVSNTQLEGAISSRASASTQLLAWHTLMHLAGSNESLRLILAPDSGMAPFRTSHFSSSARSAWAEAGYDGRIANEALDALLTALTHPNVAWGLRFSGGDFYESAVSSFLARVLAYAVPNTPVVLAVETARIKQQLAAHYGAQPLSALEAGYSAFLGIKPVDAVSPPPPPLPPRARAVQVGAPPANRRDYNILAALIVAGVVVLTITAYSLRRMGRGSCSPWRRRELVSWRSDAPGASSKTTLLITDIEGSTQLWEELPAVVMGYALRLHHSCIRRILVRHRGYESATEGDSFVLAFFGPDAALAFAMEAQQELLGQDWPAQLLATEACAPFYTSAPAGFPFKRPAALEQVLSRMAMRPHGTHSTSGAVSQPGTPHPAGQSTRARIPSFASRHVSLSQSSKNNMLGRLPRTPNRSVARMSLDCAGSAFIQSGTHRRPGALQPSAEPAALQSNPQLSNPLSPSCLTAASTSHRLAARDTQASSPLSPGDGHQSLRTSPDTEPPSSRGDEAGAGEQLRSAPLMLLGARSGLHGRQARAVVPSHLLQQQQQHPWQSNQSELSRQLQQLHLQQQLQLHDQEQREQQQQQRSSQHSAHAQSAFQVFAASGGWALIHEADESNTRVSGDVDADVASAPALAGCGSPSTSRNVTGSGMASATAAASFGGAAAELAGCVEGVVGRSEPLPKLFLQHCSSRVGSYARKHPSRVHSPAFGPHLVLASGQSGSAAAAAAAAAAATGAAPEWEASTLEAALKVAM